MNAKDRKAGLAFCKSRPLGKLILMRIVLEPLRNYLSEQFRLASADFDKKEEAKLAAAKLRGSPAPNRRYRVTEIADGSIDERFCEALRFSFQAAELWAIVPPAEQTVGMRALTFKMLARSGATFEQLLASEHRKAPWRTFLLAHGEPSLVAEFQRKPACLLDDFSKELRRDYPSMAGDEFRSVLVLLLSMLRSDISHVECKHASLRRMALVASMHTHLVPHDTLGAHWVFAQARTRHQRASRTMSATCRRQKKKMGDPMRRAARSSCRGAQRRRKAGQHTQRRGWGGAWRAWVRMHSRGLRFRSVRMGDLATGYRAAKRQRSDEYAQAAGLGKSMTSASATRAAANMPLRSIPKEKLRRIGAMEAAMRGLGPDMDATTRALTFSDISKYHGAMVGEILRVSRSTQREVRRQARGRDRRATETLATFEAGAGGRGVQDTLRFLPGVPADTVVGFPVSSPIDVGIRLQGPESEDVADALSSLYNQGWQKSVMHSLDKQWSALHETISEHAGPHVESAPQVSPCLLAGVCLCSASGKALRARGIRLENYIKWVCPPGSWRRDALVSGNFVFHIHGGAQGYIGSNDDARSVDLWLHAALQYKSPWRTTWHQVQLEDGAGELPPSPDRLYVSSTGIFNCFYIGLQKLLDCTQVFLDVWEIEESGRPVGSMCPKVVPIIRSGELGRPGRWWPSKQKAGGGDVIEEAAMDADPPPDFIDLAAADADREGEAAAEGTDLADMLLALRASFDAPLVDPEPARAAVELPPLPPPVESPPQPQGLRQVAANRLRAAAQGSGRAAPMAAPSIELENGKIVYYGTSLTFEAQCKCATHAGRCTFSKKKVGAASSSSAAAIRSPVGILAAWLSFGNETDCKSKEDHKSKELIDFLQAADMMDFCANKREDVRRLPGGEDFLKLEDAV